MMAAQVQLAAGSAGGPDSAALSGSSLDRVLRLEALRLAMERRSANDTPQSIMGVAQDFYEFINETPKALPESRATPPG